MTNANWPFDEPPNCAVLTLRTILEGAPIVYVSHDLDDDGWQFLGGESPSSDQVVLVALSEVVQLDRSVLEIADIPPGWHATRDGPSAPWQRRQS